MEERIFYLNDKSKIYYEEIYKENASPKQSIVLIHGGGQTGACYKTTPDGRKGWAYYFAEKGFRVYVPDWPGCGRSGYVPVDEINGQFVVDAIRSLIEKIDGKVTLLTHSMSGAYGWKLGELLDDKIESIVTIAPAPMGNIQPRPEVIEESNNEVILNYLQKPTKISTKELFVSDEDFLNKKLIGENNHFFPYNYIEIFKSSIQATPPKLVYERLNINDSQLKINDISKYDNMKILVVTGSQDIDHPKGKDQKIVDYFLSNKIKAEYFYLGDQGVKGNGHMLMMEKNNLEIADKIIKWIKNSEIN